MEHTNYSIMPSRNEFKYWFKRTGDNFQIIYHNDVIGHITANILGYLEAADVSDVYIDFLYDTSEYLETDIINDFNLYIRRPESIVGLPVDIKNISHTDLVNEYNNRILGCMLEINNDKYNQAGDEIAIRDFSRYYNWISQTDFFVAPASTRFHESFEYGLLVHSMNVMNEGIKLLSLDKFSTISLFSAVLVSLIHDWCKIGLYEPYEKNVKNELTGKWEKQPAYRRGKPMYSLGHGATSMYLSSKFFRLSYEESAAVRWHMGRWYVTDSEIDELQHANESLPLVLFLQFADMLAITEY